MPLRFITWNVQHGSAAFISTPNNKSIAIDLGAGDFSPLEHIKKSGLAQLDEVIVTHPHLDHIHDILNFDILSPRSLATPGHLTENEIWAGNQKASSEVRSRIAKYCEIKKRFTGQLQPGDNPEKPANNGGATIERFQPRQCPTTNVNNHSVVTIISYGSVKILSPGDNEACSWEELLKLTSFKQAIADTNILVAAHHGRESGFYKDLFDYFTPLITIVSDGRAQDTNASSRYSAVSKGWDVKKRSGAREKRYCLTTRSDGHIEIDVELGRAGNTTLEITVD